MGLNDSATDCALIANAEGVIKPRITRIQRIEDCCCPLNKRRRRVRPQTGVLTPGNDATKEKAPRGRQRPKQVVIEQVRYSVTPSGLSFVNALVPGGAPPSVVFRHFETLPSKQ